VQSLDRLMLRTAFKLASGQPEGLVTMVLTLMGLTISAPDHSTVTRRVETLPVIQPATVPPGPLHVLIDSTGLQGGLRAGGEASRQVAPEMGQAASDDRCSHLPTNAFRSAGF
jgi:hypothetical protein